MTRDREADDIRARQRWGTWIVLAPGPWTPARLVAARTFCPCWACQREWIDAAAWWAAHCESYMVAWRVLLDVGVPVAGETLWRHRALLAEPLTVTAWAQRKGMFIPAHVEPPPVAPWDARLTEIVNAKAPKAPRRRRRQWTAAEYAQWAAAQYALVRAGCTRIWRAPTRLAERRVRSLLWKAHLAECRRRRAAKEAQAIKRAAVKRADRLWNEMTAPLAVVDWFGDADAA